MKEITEKLASIAWAMSNAAKDIEKNKKNKAASSHAPKRVGPPNKVKGSKQG